MSATDENVMKYLALQELFKSHTRDSLERDPIVGEIRKRIADQTQQDPNVLLRIKTLKNKQCSIDLRRNSRMTTEK